MATFPTAIADVFDGLVTQFGGTACTYGQGSNTKALTSSEALRKDVRRDPEGGLGEDSLLCTWLVPVVEFSGGFSGTTPVYPAAGDTLTVSGESTAWHVVDIETVNGTVYVLRCRRDRQRGAA